ncbi:MAG: hypothetical protein CVU84_00265 [Firmicutes bacterium HGW-Firmicutes-1]|jgi:uncharacterized protein (UPF0297 family)|nr:MAG: hypothetical protein CVU84_00265 [Firmicutes bacterium HGW-Firmicutes-1]
MGKINYTQFFKKNDSENEHEKEVREVIAKVYEALSEKGYNPSYQIVGYILSGDPTYITSYNNARTLIGKIERDELLQEILECYINTRLK